MEYNLYRQKLDNVIDRYKQVLFIQENGEKHYWFDKDKVNKDKAFNMLDDISNEFRENNPEIYYCISSNYYQENCIFIDLAIDDFGRVCRFWGYGIDPRLGKCRKTFVFDDVVNHSSKESLERMGYNIITIEDLKTELEKLIKTNTQATEHCDKNTTYENLLDELSEKELC